MERRLHGKTPSPWSHRRTDRNHERREPIGKSHIGKREQICLGVHGKSKRKRLNGPHPDTVQAISTALGAVAGSLTGDRTTGPEKGIAGFIYAGNMNSYNKGIAYLKQEGFIQDSAVSLFKEYNRYLRLGVDWKHPAVRLPGIQADVDKNYKVINSSGIPRTADCIADEIDIRCGELI